MYVHCHKCDWSQDDFYHEGYNPAKFLMTWNDWLFGKKMGSLDQQFSGDSQFIRENGPITTREVIAQEYEKFAERIRTMKWVTYEAFEKDPNQVCPKCGSVDLDID